MNLKEELSPILERWTNDIKKVEQYYEINLKRIEWMDLELTNLHLREQKSIV